MLLCVVLLPLRAAEASAHFTNGDRGGPKPNCIYLHNAVIDVETTPQRSLLLRESLQCCARSVAVAWAGQRTDVMALLRILDVTHDGPVCFACSLDVSSRRRLADASAPVARQQYLLRMSGSLGPARVAALRQELAGIGAHLGIYVPLHTHLMQALPDTLDAIRRLAGATRSISCDSILHLCAA